MACPFLSKKLPWLRLLLLSPWSVSFSSTETDSMFSIIGFSHIFLSPSIAPLILLIKNWFLKGEPLPIFKVLGHCYCVGTIHCPRQGWWKVFASLTSVVATTWSLASELSNPHKHCNHLHNWWAIFSKAGPTSNSSLLWHLKSQGLPMHTYSNWGCKRKNKWDQFSREEYKSYRLEWSNLTDSWHMQRAHQTLEKRFAVLSDFLKMKGQSLGKCNLGQYCCNSEIYIITLTGVSFMPYCNAKPYCSVWASQMNKMRTLHGELNNQGEEYLKIVFVVNPFYASSGKIATAAGHVHLNPLTCLPGSEKQGVKTPLNWHLNYTLLNKKVTFGAYELGLAFFSIWTFICNTGFLVIVSKWEIPSQVADRLNKESCSVIKQSFGYSPVFPPAFAQSIWAVLGPDTLFLLSRIQ